MNKKKCETQIFCPLACEPDLIAYTDGGCALNPGGPGGIGVVIIDPATGKAEEYSEGWKTTTNNRMEISAILKALSVAKERGAKNVRLYSDSQYAIKVAAGEWAGVKNADLWAAYWKAAQGLNIEFQWVRGHSGNKYNERCDELATDAMSRFLSGEANAHADTGGGAMSIHIQVPQQFCAVPMIENAASFAEERGINLACAASVKAFLEKKEPSFKDFLSVKSDGKDRFSSMSAERMAELLPEYRAAFEAVSPYFRDDGHTLSCIRWYLRGLPLDACVRHELVTMEVSANALKAIFKKR